MSSTNLQICPDAARTLPALDGRIARRVAALVATILVLFGAFDAFASSSASAMSPQQTTLTGTINTLYWDLDGFWRFALNNPSYRSPTIGYYYASPTNVPQCVGNLFDYMIMAECPNNGNAQIWINYGVNQDKVTRLGDYAAGFFLAHEFGHHIGNVLGLRFPTIRGRELYADCMAGVFTKYALTQTHRLDNSDYWEGVASLDDRFPNEGGPVTAIRRRPIARPGTGTATRPTASPRAGRRSTSKQARSAPRRKPSPAAAGLRAALFTSRRPTAGGWRGPRSPAQPVQDPWSGLSVGGRRTVSRRRPRAANRTPAHPAARCCNGRARDGGSVYRRLCHPARDGCHAPDTRRVRPRSSVGPRSPSVLLTHDNPRSPR